MNKTLYPEIEGIDFPLITLNIVDKIYINQGIAFMGFMNDNFYFINDINETAYKGINPVELDFVKFLYRIRRANKKKEKVEYQYFSGPNGFTSRERIFIAGKIFPYMNLTYKAKDADATKIVESSFISFKDLRLLFDEPYDKRYSLQYINVDNEKIRVIVPKDAMRISYSKLMLDFLTNGPLTKDTVIYGEFPDKATCELAVGYSIEGNLPEGCWLKSDRKLKTDPWKNACEYILKNKKLGVLAPFSQIHDFYEYVGNKLLPFKHEIRWIRGAKALVDALTRLEGGAWYVDNSIEIILSELNLGICDFAITQFYELFYGKYKNTPLQGEKAYLFDKQFIEYEQGVVATPIYEKTDESIIYTFQAMADKEPGAGVKDGVMGTGGLFNFVTPEFDDPLEGKVTDPGFRTDLPLLMLWLDRHMPTSESFKGKTYTVDTYVTVNNIRQLHKKGTLLEKYRKIIRKYEKK
ncbi:MAG TPA: hypothetical protein VF677_02130 [Flavobacterium sp.]|jgi:hypothetical protein